MNLRGIIRCDQLQNLQETHPNKSRCGDSRVLEHDATSSFSKSPSTAGQNAVISEKRRPPGRGRNPHVMSHSSLFKGEIPVNCSEIGGASHSSTLPSALEEEYRARFSRREKEQMKSKTCGGVTEGEGEIPLLPTRWSKTRCCGENSGRGRPFIHSELNIVLQWTWLVRRSVRQANRLKRVPDIPQQPRDNNYDAAKPETVTTISLHPQGRSSVIIMV